MTLRIILIATATTALVAACATQPNNPNYQFSTKYKASAPTQMASAQTMETTQVETTPVTYAPTQATYTRVDEQCIQGGAAVPCYPQEFTTGQTEAVINAPYQGPVNVIMATSETPTAMTTPPPAETVGTPGYHAVQNIDTDYAYPEAQMTGTAQESVPAVTLPVTVDSDPKSHMGVYRPATDEGFINHRIVEGDTVYSMSRQLCVSIDDIKTINGLDENFSLRLDDVIRLPASRC